VKRIRPSLSLLPSRALPIRITSRRRRAARITGAACLLALSSTPAAHAGGVSVGPSRIDAAVRPGSTLGPVVLHNGSPRTVVIDVAPSMIGQALTGLAQIDPSPTGRAAAARLIRPSQRRVRLAPGATARITARVLARPPRGLAAYAALIFTARNPSSGAAPISPSVRLSTNLLLRFPGPARIHGRATGVRAEQGPGRTLSLTSTVANTGNLHAKPRGTLTIANASGATVVRRALVPANVLPGARREFVAAVQKLLPRGDYVARTAVSVGRRRSVARSRFHLVGPNRLPTARLSLAPLTSPRAELDTPFTEPVEVVNSGTAAGTAVLRWALRGPNGGGIVRRGAVALPAVLPGGDGGRQEIRLPGLRTGIYDLSASVDAGGREVARDAVQFSPRARAGPWDRLRDWLAGHLVAVGAGAALLLLAVIGVLLTYIRRLRRALTPESAGV
jgi:hypothetical protein